MDKRGGGGPGPRPRQRGRRGGESSSSATRGGGRGRGTGAGAGAGAGAAAAGAATRPQSNRERAEELRKVHFKRAQEALTQEEHERTTNQKDPSRHSHTSSKGQHNTSATSQAGSDTDRRGRSDTVERCILCANDLDVKIVRPCGHNDICCLCTARMRVLLKDLRCPVCKQEAENVVATTRNDMDYESFGISPYGDIGGPNLIHDEASGIFFDDKANYENIVNLRRFKAGVEGDEAVFDSFSSLQKYLKDKYGKTICEVCYNHHHRFVMELPRMTFSEWKSHCKHGSKSTGFLGHTFCQFCKKRFYGDTELFVHMRDNHFHCDVCVQEGAQDIFFQHHRDVLQHYRQYHYVCEEPSCLEFPYIAFSSEIGLISHMGTVHGKKLSKSDRRINLWADSEDSYRYSENDDDFTAVRESFTSAQSGSSSAVSLMADSSAFPSLPSSNASISERLIARAPPRGNPTYNAQSLNEDQFPQLSRTPPVENGSLPSSTPYDSATFNEGNQLGKQWGVNIKVKKGKQAKPKKTSKSVSKENTCDSVSRDKCTSPTERAYASTADTGDNLLSKVERICQSNPLKLEEFKRLSREFYSGQLSSNKYFRLISHLFKDSELHSFFSDLIRQLPDEKKKEELSALYQRTLSSETGKYTTGSSCNRSVEVGPVTGDSTKTQGSVNMTSDSYVERSAVDFQQKRAVQVTNGSPLSSIGAATNTQNRPASPIEADRSFPSLSDKCNSRKKNSEPQNIRNMQHFYSSLARKESPRISKDALDQLTKTATDTNSTRWNTSSARDDVSDSDDEFGALRKGLSGEHTAKKGGKQNQPKGCKSKGSKKILLR